MRILSSLSAFSGPHLSDQRPDWRRLGLARPTSGPHLCLLLAVVIYIAADRVVFFSLLPENALTLTLNLDSSSSLLSLSGAPEPAGKERKFPFLV